mmetsp:Transcript_33209/g.76641  ORF Transcript_33209/g.76641 Transcript_33209/m.76641 type:complete len:283 (+) Transcript_33209:1885-2733(+)
MRFAREVSFCAFRDLVGSATEDVMSDDEATTGALPLTSSRARQGATSGYFIRTSSSFLGTLDSDSAPSSGAALEALFRAATCIDNICACASSPLGLTPQPSPLPRVHANLAASSSPMAPILGFRPLARSRSKASAAAMSHCSWKMPVSVPSSMFLSGRWKEKRPVSASSLTFQAVLPSRSYHRLSSTLRLAPPLMIASTMNSRLTGSFRCGTPSTSGVGSGRSSGRWVRLAITSSHASVRFTGRWIPKPSPRAALAARILASSSSFSRCRLEDRSSLLLSHS